MNGGDRGKDVRILKKHPDLKSGGDPLQYMYILNHGNICHQNNIILFQQFKKKWIKYKKSRIINQT